MGSRVISAILTLKDNFSKGMRKAAENADDFNQKLKQVENQSSRMRTTTVASFGAIGAGMVGLGAASAVGIAGVGALAGTFGAAGIGAAAFGAVAVSALGSVFTAAEDVAKLEEKIANADTAKERIAAQKELAAVYEGMGESQKGALQSLQNFKSFWGGFVKEFENPIFDAFAKGLQGTQTLLNNLKPTIHGVSGVVVNMMDSFNKSMEGSSAKEFFAWLGESAPRSLTALGQITGNVFSGIFSMFQAFTPLTIDVENGLVGMTEKFKNWAAGLSESKGFQSFIDYARTNGPVIVSTIGNIASVAQQLIADLAPLGTTVLSGLQSVTSLMANNWPMIRETVIGLGTAVGTAVVAMKGFQFLSVVNTLFAAWRAGTLKQTIATMSLNAALLMNPITWIVAGIAAAVAVGVLLYRNWDLVKQKAGELWSGISSAWSSIVAATSAAWSLVTSYVSSKFSEAKNKVVEIATGIWNGMVSTWESVKQSTSDTWNSLKTAISDAMSSAWSSVTEFFSPLLDFISRAKGAWDDFVGKITSFKMPKFDFPSLPSWLGGGGGKGKADGSHATGLASVPFDGYRAILHRGEAVLTASQAGALRSAGMLKENGDGTPTLNFDTSSRSVEGKGGTSTTTVTNNTTTNKSGGNPVVLNVYPQGMTARSVIDELVPELKLVLANM
ncbi:hypothetical protein [Bacillus manliponensis]|uniref:hypothetical protein n=1 Tax=Bacillus manliponensis TaxID=574376 RepID=UPI0035148583